MTMNKSVLGVLVFSAVGLSACGSPNLSETSVESVAQCIIGNMSKEDLQDAGWRLGTQQDMKVFSDKHLKGCADESKWKWDDKLAQTHLTPKVGQKVLYSPDFRFGVYASMSGSSAPIAQRKAFGEIGTKLENFMGQRALLLNCGNQDNTQEIAEATLKSTFLTKLDTPFTVASLGIHGGVASVDIAQKISVEMLSRAKEFTPMNGNFTASCGPNVSTDIQAQATEYLTFYKGKHPWAPGCYIKQVGMEMVLKCDGVNNIPKDASPSALAPAPATNASPTASAAQ